jgi:hypothetical protein
MADYQVAQMRTCSEGIIDGEMIALLYSTAYVGDIVVRGFSVSRDPWNPLTVVKIWYYNFILPVNHPNSVKSLKKFVEIGKLCLDSYVPAGFGKYSGPSILYRFAWDRVWHRRDRS